MTGIGDYIRIEFSDVVYGVLMEFFVVAVQAEGDPFGGSAAM